MSLPRSILVFTLLLMALALGTDGTPCIGYAKGAFTGDVTTKDICETACEVAEGLPKPDFKVSLCTDIGNVTTTLYDCSCVRANNVGAYVEQRGLCDDGPCAGDGESRAPGDGLLLLLAANAVTGLLLLAA